MTSAFDRSVIRTVWVGTPKRKRRPYSYVNGGSFRAVIFSRRLYLRIGIFRPNFPATVFICVIIALKSDHGNTRHDGYFYSIAAIRSSILGRVVKFLISAFYTGIKLCSTHLKRIKIKNNNSKGQRRIYGKLSRQLTEQQFSYIIFLMGLQRSDFCGPPFSLLWGSTTILSPTHPPIRPWTEYFQYFRTLQPFYFPSSITYSVLRLQGRPKDHSLGLPADQFFAVSSENTDFPKKLFNTETFSIKFVIKKVILIIGVRWPLLKNTRVP